MNSRLLALTLIVLSITGCSDLGTEVLTFKDIPETSVEFARASIIGKWHLRQGVVLIHNVVYTPPCELVFHADGTVTITQGIHTDTGPYTISASTESHYLFFRLLDDYHYWSRVCSSMFGWDDRPTDGSIVLFERVW